jgi:hypothetical protein
MRRLIFAALLVLALDPQAYAQPSFDSRGSLRAVTAASAKAPASLAEAKRRRAGSS